MSEPNQAPESAVAGPRRHTGHPARTVIYTWRTETDSHEQRIQEDRCRDLADRHGLDVIAVLHDIGPAATGGRDRWHQLQEMMHAAEVDLVLAVTPATFGHTGRELAELHVLARAHDVTFLFASGQSITATAPSWPDPTDTDNPTTFHPGRETEQTDPEAGAGQGPVTKGGHDGPA